jgi:hypothetical protein
MTEIQIVKDFCCKCFLSKLEILSHIVRHIDHLKKTKLQNRNLVVKFAIAGFYPNPFSLVRGEEYLAKNFVLKMNEQESVQLNAESAHNRLHGPQESFC